MIEGSIARRYAQAVLDLARDEGIAERVGSELDDFVATLERVPVIREVIVHPGFGKDERKALLHAVLERSGYARITRDFLLLLVDKSRIGAYGEIARAYARGLDEAMGRVHATVRSAGPLDAGTLARLRQHLERVTGKTVVLESQVDPSLIGGLVTQVGSLVFDGSIRTQLEAMRSRLLRDEPAIA
ncbi:ATP synthase F1 subunit delta [Myxococcota bacterium]|nr:ATP synthase F1 subunit delta [Myxococcota bacterium]